MRLAMPGRVLLIVLACAAPVAAQTTVPDPVPDLSTDRPGFNAPASVVGSGVVQLELGWSMHRAEGGTTASDGPEPLLRVGLGHRLELQLSTLGFEAGCAVDCRWLPGDLQFGARYALPVEPLGVALAVTGAVALPTGHGEVTSHHAEPTGIVHADRDLGAGFGLSYNLVLTRTYDVAPDAAVRVGHGLALGYEIGTWAPYAAVARRAFRVGADVPWVAQVGTSVRLTPDVQVDVTVDRGLTAAEPRWGISAGLALRRRPR